MKRHRLGEQIRKQDLAYMLETHLRCRDTYRPKVRGETIFHADGNQRKLKQQYSHRTKQTIVRRDKAGQHIKINRSKMTEQL